MPRVTKGRTGVAADAEGEGTRPATRTTVKAKSTVREYFESIVVAVVLALAAFLTPSGRAKGERLALITDNVAVPSDTENANALASFGAGAVHDDGSALRLADGTLAGSRLTLDRALANAQAFGALSRLEAVRAATLAPARVLGIERERGSLRLGARADFAMLAADGAVAETWIAGRCVWRREEAR